MAATGACSGIGRRIPAAPAQTFKARSHRPNSESGAASYAASLPRAANSPIRRPSIKRRWVLSAVVLTVTLATAGLSLGQGIELSSSASCSEIVGAIRRLAVAEHRQAQALELMARGGDTALVEAKFQLLLERKRELSFALKRISMDPVAGDPSVNKCLSNGYQALYQSDRLSANIERILVRSRLRSQSAAPLSELRQPPAATP